jgi:hypothetical protein
MAVDLAPLRLDSRARRQIRNFPRLEQNPAQLRIRVQVHQRGHPAATLRSATGVYNCFGLAFASRRTWVDEQEVRQVLMDDGYRPTSREDLREGDLVIYSTRPGGIDHVAVVTAFDWTDPSVVWVISQWGTDGEWKHRIDDVPGLCGSPAEFWTDRRLVSAT